MSRKFANKLLTAFRRSIERDDKFGLCRTYCIRRCWKNGLPSAIGGIRWILERSAIRTTHQIADDVGLPRDIELALFVSSRKARRMFIVIREVKQRISGLQSSMRRFSSKSKIKVKECHRTFWDRRMTLSVRRESASGECMNGFDSLGANWK